MILVDTSVWIDHFRFRNATLVDLLETKQVPAHPWIIGELALGNLRQRSTVLRLLRGLPQVMVAADDEVLQLIERQALFGSGLGYIDAQLLAASRITPNARLWTMQKRLSQVSKRLGVGFLSP